VCAKSISALSATIFLIFWMSSYGCTEALARGPFRPSGSLSVKETLEAEQRLWELGYWAGPVDGKFDADSRHALIAFQKVERRPRTGNLTLLELHALRQANRPVARHTRYPHVEIDLERQVLFVIGEDGMVFRILPVSSGSGELYLDQGQIHRARTPIGAFKVLRKINGWRRSSLGLLYYPSYIFNGIAIHGNPSVPTRPVSHGCIRVPMFAARELSSLMPVGIDVVIYDDRTGARGVAALSAGRKNEQ
jgi:peptidoglycan hydrolase-like protein with peptidoglycan-binding domain